jgi:hypothetical protein
MDPRLMGSIRGEPASRHWRALALIAVSMLVVASASAVYLRPISATKVGTLPVGVAIQDKGFMVLPDLAIQPPPGPSPSPRKVGLVRRGANGVLINQFGGMNDQPAFVLKASLETSDPEMVSKLVHDLNALPAFPDGVISCPIDDGSHFVLEFAYADGTRASVTVEATGCSGVYIGGSNHAVAWTRTAPAFLDALNGMLAPNSALTAST